MKGILDQSKFFLFSVVVAAPSASTLEVYTDYVPLLYVAHKY